MAGWHGTSVFSVLLVACLLLVFGSTVGRNLHNSCQAKRPPVVIIPGDLGNQLEAKLDKPSVVHYICYKKTDAFFTLWLNLELLVPVAIDCWIDNIRCSGSDVVDHITSKSFWVDSIMEHDDLEAFYKRSHSVLLITRLGSSTLLQKKWSQRVLIYNTTTHSTSAPPGVDIRVPGFGKTYSVEYLDPSKSSLGMYFFSLVQAFVEWGYTRDDDVRGAPYDWRKAPNENKAYFLALQQMIEEMAEKAGGPVVLIAHSMGNVYTLYFLNHQPQAWKDRYIKSFVALGAPWAGVAKTLRVVTSGDNDHIPVISPLKMRSQQRSAITTTWLLPYANTWPKNQVLIQTPTYNYTVADYKRFFSDVGFAEGWQIRQDTEPLISDLAPPGVAIHCLYGSGVPTAETYRYSDKFPNAEPVGVVMGDGDGTVNLQSATQCGRWVGRQRQPVKLLELPGNEHVNMLLNYTTVAYIKTVLCTP